MQAFLGKRLSFFNSILVTILILVGAMSSMALAADEQSTLGLSTNVYSASIKSLTMLFVIAVILESAFAVIFNWRVFLAFFDTKGVKTVLMVLISSIVVFGFKIDIFANLVVAFSVPDTLTDKAAIAQFLSTHAADTSNFWSKLITAFVLAGGSSGIHNLMYALGIRTSRDAEVTPKPDQDQAWVSVSIKRKNIVGPVQIGVVKVDGPPAGETAIPLSGTVRFARPTLQALLMRAVNRFPANGGYVVEPNKIYLVSAVADVPGAKPGEQVPFRTQPRYYTFSPRAVVDLSIEITGPAVAVVEPIKTKDVVPPAADEGR
ncbi:hypothetical protein [Rhizobium sp. C4]|uniref:hypothetical protein n=1 Tax=Rhizobium sp. C4 TaxID=1349800 RepID=UPI001E5CD275|nr:hypothetical protein [Rhizobium sp. C4]MCD2175048.1 hypothetical protein [Rhizobium sp. C4]